MASLSQNHQWQKKNTNCGFNRRNFIESRFWKPSWHKFKISRVSATQSPVVTVEVSDRGLHCTMFWLVVFVGFHWWRRQCSGGGFGQLEQWHSCGSVLSAVNHRAEPVNIYNAARIWNTYLPWIPWIHTCVGPSLNNKIFNKHKILVTSTNFRCIQLQNAGTPHFFCWSNCTKFFNERNLCDIKGRVQKPESRVSSVRGWGYPPPPLSANFFPLVFRKKFVRYGGRGGTPLFR